MKQTSLFENHKSLGAKIVPFGGWEMPVVYSNIREEHQAVRTAAGLFDVSHMGEIVIRGHGAFEFVQQLICNDLDRLKPGQCQYTGLMTPQGTFVDDIIVYPFSKTDLLLCVNAGNTDKDFAWVEKQAPESLVVENASSQWGQLALQGPRAQEILASLDIAEATSLKRFHFCEVTIDGQKILLSRTGYTGEDGFELYADPSTVVALWDKLLAAGQSYGLLPCGLGARDTLRLEAAYPLYGHEISDQINPYEARLSWIVKLGKESFIGKEALQQVFNEGAQRTLIGFVMDERQIPREGYSLFSDDIKLGTVVSGTWAPTLEQGIGTGLVPPEYATIGSKIDVDIRGKKRKATVVKLPFVQSK